MEKFEKIFREYTKNAYEGVVFRNVKGEKDDAQYGIDLDKKFPIGGVTKLFTIACALKLIENKKLILDSKLAIYLTDEESKNLCTYKGEDYTKEITIRDLIYQTSGLPDYFTNMVRQQIPSGDVKYTFNDKLEWTRELKAIDKPGKSVYYSSLNADLLVYVIEKNTGKKIMDVYKEFIFTPLNLRNTYIPENDNVLIPPVYFGDRPLKRNSLIISSYGSGGLISTTRELMKFIVALFEGKIFDVSLMQKITKFNSMINGLDNVLYGGGLMKIKSKKNILGQTGYTGAFAFADPDNKVYYVGYLSQPDAQPQLIKMVEELFEKA